MTKSVKKVSKNVSILGTKELSSKIAMLSPELQTTTSRILHGGAKKIGEDIKASMALSPPSGKKYGGHIASSPGNPPRIDTADLVNAVTTQPKQFNQSTKNTLVGVFKTSGQAKKAVWLEFGTKHIAERPFARPAYLMARPDILKNVKKALKTELEKITK